MSGGYTSFGRYFCPRCVCRREFISDDPQQADANLGECVECGYQHGYVSDEITGERRPRLTPEMVAKARARFTEEWRATMVSSGVRLEAFTGQAMPHRLHEGGEH